MRHHYLIIGALLALLAAAAPALAVDISGKWAGTWEAVGNPRGPITDVHYTTLTQNGDAITGTTGPKRDVQWSIQNAKLDGNKLTFNVTTGALELAFRLELTDEGLTGTVTLTNREGISWKMRMKREN